MDLTAETVTIGRGRRNDFVIQDNEVSREHCRLVRVLNDYEIHDLNSTNGTFVNGRRVDSSGWLLTAGAVIELGDSITLEYVPTEMNSNMIIPVMQMETGELEEWHLVIRRPDETEPVVIGLSQSIVAIGRDTDNDYIVPEPEISRHHVRLLRTHDGYVIEDLNTLNGTHLNGQKLERQVLLKEGDYVRIGQQTEMWYTAQPDELELVPREMVTAASSAESKTVVNERRPTPTPGTMRPINTATLVDHGLQPDQLIGHILIAYPREHWNEIIAPMLLFMQDHQVPTWVDQYLTTGSDHWQSAVDQALSECTALVVLMTKEGLELPYIQRSMRHFAAREKPVVMLEYGDITHEDLPMALGNAVTVKYDADNQQVTFRNILDAIRDTLSKPTTPPENNLQPVDNGSTDANASKDKAKHTQETVIADVKAQLIDSDESTGDSGPIELPDTDEQPHEETSEVEMDEIMEARMLKEMSAQEEETKPDKPDKMPSKDELQAALDQAAADEAAANNSGADNDDDDESEKSDSGK